LKQVIVVDESLNLPRGKLAAQVAHAAVEAFLAASPKIQTTWLEQGMPKVVLRASCAGEIVALAEHARRAGLPVAVIRDAGRTVVSPGTMTCLGIGPAEEQQIDPLTGDLELVK
jgi:peptidyl-tRNA hydrolase, PTH2 family